MTTQAGESLRYDGEDLSMDVFPLESLFTQRGERPEFDGWNTALDRGYFGSWEIDGDRLYLVKFSADLPDGTEASVSTLFPGEPGRVFARWYSGTIRAPRGRQVGYDEADDVLLYEQEVVLEVREGVVVGMQVKPGGRG